MSDLLRISNCKVFTWKGENTTGDCSQNQEAVPIDWSGLAGLATGIQKAMFHNMMKNGAGANTPPAGSGVSDTDKGAMAVPVGDNSVNTTVDGEIPVPNNRPSLTKY